MWASALLPGEASLFEEAGTDRSVCATQSRSVTEKPTHKCLCSFISVGERVEQAFRPAVCCILGSAALAAEVRSSGAEAQHLSCLNAGLKPCSTLFSRAFRLFMRWLLSTRYNVRDVNSAPPSTTMVCPVKYDEPSPASSSATSATSFGCPRCWMGCLAMTCAVRLSSFQ